MAPRIADRPVDFDAPDLAARIETLAPAERDRLPFGVIELDREGKVLVYSATEARLSGYGMTALGKNFFVVAQSANKGELEARIMRAMEEGPVDLEFGWIGGYGTSQRELRLRVLSSRRGGVWIFVERDERRPATRPATKPATKPSAKSSRKVSRKVSRKSSRKSSRRA